MKPRKELLIALGILAFCALNLLYFIPAQVAAEGSSTRYPHLLNGMLAFFALAYGLEALRLMWKASAEERAGGEPGPSFLDVYGRTLLLMGITGIWLFTMEVTGFIMSTFIFLPIAAYIFGSRSRWKPVVLGLVMPLIFYGVFRGLHSQLPQGPVEALLSRLLD
jgi:hypothetical protein